jgi:hypothetical protein
MRVLSNSVKECLNESGASSLQMSQKNVIVEESSDSDHEPLEQSIEESKSCNKRR